MRSIPLSYICILVRYTYISSVDKQYHVSKNKVYIYIFFRKKNIPSDWLQICGKRTAVPFSLPAHNAGNAVNVVLYCIKKKIKKLIC